MLKTITTQPAQNPIDLPPVPPSFNTPTEIIIYVTLFITLCTNALEALTDLLEKLKTLHKTWKPVGKAPHGNRPKPKKRSKK